jgi:hypothetical protein
MLAGFAAGLCARGPPFSGPAHEIRLPLRRLVSPPAWPGRAGPLRPDARPARPGGKPAAPHRRRSNRPRRPSRGKTGHDARHTAPAVAGRRRRPGTAGRPNAPPPAPPPPPLSDIIFTNGDVITLDDKRPAAQAVAVKGSKIIAVGKSKDILARWKSEGTEVVDLAGKTLVPGFVDAWGQMSRLGLYSVAARCSRRRKAA